MKIVLYMYTGVDHAINIFVLFTQGLNKVQEGTNIWE